MLNTDTIERASKFAYEYTNVFPNGNNFLNGNGVVQNMSRTIDEIEQLYYYSSISKEEIFSEVESEYQSSDHDSGKRARSAFMMGMYSEMTDFPRACSFYNEAYRVAVKLNDKSILSDAMHGQAFIAFSKGDLKRVERLEEQAMEFATESGHQFRVAFSHYSLATVALLFGSNEDGVLHLDRGLTIVERYGFLRLQLAFYSKLAELHLISRDLSKAREYASQALGKSIELSMKRQILDFKIRLATISFELKNYGEVTKLITSARKALPKENHSLWCVTHTLLGRVHEAKRRYHKAEAEFREALALANYVNAERVRSNVHAHLAELYLKTQKPEAALTEALAALTDAETAQDSYVWKEALRCVHDCYKALGQYKEAHEYLERYNALIVESDTALLKNRLEYHALKSEHEKEKLKSEAHVKQSELLRIKLDYKERELTEKIRHLLKQAEAVRQFRNDLRSLVRRTPPNDPYVKDIRARLSSFTEDDLNWQEFEKEFREVHPEFLQTLIAKYPDLTQTEQRVAAMIRMELKSVDIARLICVAERTVEFHRLNLRKKLGLQRGEDLRKLLVKI